MNLQKQSWIMLSDRIFHYQKDSKILCNNYGKYGLYEEYNPPKKDRCKDCEKELEL